jgi:hypothetical protein
VPFRLTAAALALSLAVPAARPPFRTASFRTTTSAAGAAPLTAQMWIAPEGSLEERRDEKGVTHVLRTRGEIFAWVEGTGRGVRAPDSGPARAAGRPEILSVLRELPEDILPGNVSRVGREKLSGLRVRRYDFRVRQSPAGPAREGTAWLLEDRDFPVKFRCRGPAGEFEIVNSGFRFDEEIPARFFDIPADVRFTDLRTPAGAAPH